VDYYHRSRTHLGLEKGTPEPRPIQSADMGRIIAMREVAGLHHRYERRAAKRHLRVIPSALARPIEGHRGSASELLGIAERGNRQPKTRGECGPKAFFKKTNGRGSRPIRPQDEVSQNDSCDWQGRLDKLLVCGPSAEPNLQTARRNIPCLCFGLEALTAALRQHLFQNCYSPPHLL